MTGGISEVADEANEVAYVVSKALFATKVTPFATNEALFTTNGALFVASEASFTTNEALSVTNGGSLVTDVVSPGASVRSDDGIVMEVALHWCSTAILLRPCASVFLSCGVLDASCTALFPMKNALAILLSLGVLTAAASAGEVRRLTPHAAAAIAIENSAALNDARRVAAAERLAARVLPNPSLSTTHDFVVGSTKDVKDDAYSVGLDFEMTKLLTRGATLRSAEATYAAASLKVSWDEFQTANLAKKEIVKVALNQRALASAIEAQKNFTVNAAQIRAAGTSETELNSAAADAAARQSDVTRLETEQALVDERLALNIALGLPVDDVIVPEAAQALAALRAAPLPTVAEATAAVETHRPDLLALQMGKNSQDAKVRAAILGRFPAVTLGVQQQRDTSDIESRGVTLSFSVPVFDRGQGAVATESATQQQLANDYINRVNIARSDVAKALADMRFLRLKLAATEKALAAHVRLSDALENAYRNGGMESAAVYTARNEVTASRGALIAQETALAEAASALALATGTDYFYNH